MALDLIIFGKIEQNRFILGMAQFSIGIVFNSLTFFMLFFTGLFRQSTGLYLLFLMVANTMTLITGVLMEEFYNPLIDVDVFGDSDDPLKLCQAIYFLHEMFYYWRWFLMAMIIIDRCLVVLALVEWSRLRLISFIMSVVLLVVSAGLAGYWISWVDDTFKSSPIGYTKGLCRIIPTPQDDTSSTWFYMESFGKNAIQSSWILLGITIC